MKKEKLNPALIRAVYNSHHNQQKIINELNNRLSHPLPPEEWISMLLKFSETRKVAFNVNTETGALLSDVIFSDAPLSYDYAEAFYREDTHLGGPAGIDVYFSTCVLTRLVSFYREQHDIIRLLPLLSRLGKMYTATVKMHFDYNYLKAVNCFKEILSFKDSYSLIPEISVRRIFWEAYHNLCCELPVINCPGSISASASLDILLEALSFYNSEAVRKIDGRSEEIRRDIDNIKEDWLNIECIIDSADVETRAAFAKVASDVYTGLMTKTGGNTYAIPFRVVLAYQHGLILDGSTSYIDAVNFMIDYYYSRRQKSLFRIKEGESVPIDFEFETEIPLALIKWLDKISILSDMCDTLRSKLINEVNSYYSGLFEKNYFSEKIRDSLRDWCIFSLKYIFDPAEKEKLIVEMLINRQPLTFFDSYLSCDVAGMIAESLHTLKPALLAPVGAYLKSFGRVGGRLDIIDYIKKCALFHDVGMNLINHIAAMQSRSLYPEEKDILKLHTSLGAELFTGELSIYREPILAHHKYFDQSEGYPADVDTSDSPLKIVCDILAVTDSLIAGTDNVGRCYRESKDFSIVLSELITLSGSRYNTNVVNLFLDDMDLSCKVDSLISNNREKAYYDYYVKYFDKSRNLR